MLPGWSANKWSGAGLVGGVMWIVGTIGGAICAATLVRQNEALDPITWSFLALFGTGLSWLAFSFWMMRIKEAREVAAGYTTMAQGHYDVERRHSPTGVIMRGAGQPALTRSQWEDAMGMVREYQHHPSGCEYKSGR